MMRLQFSAHKILRRTYLYQSETSLYDDVIPFELASTQLRTVPLQLVAGQLRADSDSDEGD